VIVDSCIVESEWIGMRKFTMLETIISELTYHKKVINDVIS
jgi:hypothetical protein